MTTPDNKNASFYVELPSRGLIEIEGEERYAFLQRLISNDIDLLKTQPAIYACLLTPQGKFLHDFFVTEGPDVLLIDCEGHARAQDLYERLQKYKLRTKVNISVEPANHVYVCYNAQPDPGYLDPRHEDLGWRSYIHPENAKQGEFSSWDEKRIALGIIDGSRDAVVEKSTLDELNIEKFNGVSYTKGCFVGQELTARMHHRGLGKKHLKVVQGETLPPSHTDLKSENSKLVGEMRSSSGDKGLALLKDDFDGEFDEYQIRILG